MSVTLAITTSTSSPFDDRTATALVTSHSGGDTMSPLLHLPLDELKYCRAAMISVSGLWAQPACGLHSGCMLLISSSLPILPDGSIELMMGLDAHAATKS